ncbi:hypothetical protein LTR10_014053 [Elasticomyces elasticus]|uniref:Coiled-coil domain-containing protein 16 n=1 Tax=Exophiala sideris TaxID=1016849 RepID=A0ABR0J3U2_9EURO|nr:hypothetical protein LTR10_014053 [Elasticomyces elasticus]KAK5026459.1 hypothetical protein LTS07_007393 [Exophiala sideris]KAK5033799.1 hypothetical protein LTR13_006851 [Exophiala sideris]KAK5055621.1 hypothetical protein LTR69_008454 [Exophiala sideris]KAK5179994.1 hypothetical protein LTR44_007470 [Eurotiomycetes sp. CCFEE 6388]
MAGNGKDGFATHLHKLRDAKQRRRQMQWQQRELEGSQSHRVSSVAGSKEDQGHVKKLKPGFTLGFIKANCFITSHSNLRGQQSQSLNVKSEALWEGHLRSANHRKNVVQQTQESTNKPTKRKIEDVEEEQEERYEAAHIDARKKAKSKSRPKTVSFEVGDDVEKDPIPVQEDSESLSKSETPQSDHLPAPAPAEAETANHSTDATVAVTSDPAPGPGVDEDEWAAFEREVAPLAAAQPPPDYASATIVAAPVTADQIKEQTDEDRRRRLEAEAEDEQEDEERRLEEEFDVMEEMEERVRKLREKRDALRHPVLAATDTGQVEPTTTVNGTEQEKTVNGDGEDDDDEEDEDDWYS